MRNIIELEGTEYLRQTYRCAQAYSDYLKESGAADIMARSPELTGKETEEEKLQKYAEQQIKNVKDMNRLCFEEKPELTMKLLPCFVVPDEGEKPSVKAMAAAMNRALGDSGFIDFFMSLR